MYFKINHIRIGSCNHEIIEMAEKECFSSTSKAGGRLPEDTSTRQPLLESIVNEHAIDSLLFVWAYLDRLEGNAWRFVEHSSVC